MVLFISLSVIASTFLLTSSNSYLLFQQRSLHGVEDNTKNTLLNHNEYRNLFLGLGLLSSTLITYSLFNTTFNHLICTNDQEQTFDKIDRENIVTPVIIEPTPTHSTQNISNSFHNPEEKKNTIKAPVLLDTTTQDNTIDTDALDYGDIDDKTIAITPTIMDTSIYKPSDIELLSNAHFKGGYIECQKFLRDNIKFPQELLDQKAEGKVYLTFIINADGSIQNAKVLKGTTYTSFNKEALRVINIMPNWEPAIKEDSSTVRQQLIIPIDFEVN